MLELCVLLIESSFNNIRVHFPVFDTVIAEQGYEQDKIHLL
jgi:hypothetical protein